MKCERRNPISASNYEGNIDWRRWLDSRASYLTYTCDIEWHLTCIIREFNFPSITEHTQRRSRIDTVLYVSLKGASREKNGVTRMVETRRMLADCACSRIIITCHNTSFPASCLLRAQEWFPRLWRLFASTGLALIGFQHASRNLFDVTRELRERVAKNISDYFSAFRLWCLRKIYRNLLWY